jgi:hypothetical protein
MWASNRYWLTPAQRVAPLLERYNLDPSVPGSYQVNGTVRKANGDNEGNPVVPRLGRYLDPALYQVAVVPVLVAGAQAYVMPGRSYLAAHQTADGEFLGLDADSLAWLSGVTTAGEGLHYGNMRLMAGEPASEMGNRSVALVADLIRTVTPSGPDGEGGWTEAVRETTGVRVIGMIASVKLGS